MVYPVPGSAACAGPDSDRVDGLILGEVEGAPTHLLVPTNYSDGVIIGLLPIEATSTTLVRGLDPIWVLRRVRAAVADIVPLSGNIKIQWPAALAASRRAIALKLTGVVRHTLGTVVAHASARSQFGRPIGSNQAVQYRLADVLVDLESAELVADEAWTTRTPVAAKVAKALAGRAMAAAAAICQQALGAFGYSWEHEFHRYLKRGLVLDRLLGSCEELETQIGRDIATTGVERIGQL